MVVARKPFPPIPYGMADFSAIRREGFLYVDKTRFLRDLEDERHVFLLRPRRFGKSCWVSILQHYYDRVRKDNFETLFADTDIGREPTANHSQYAVLRLDFSSFDKDIATLRDRFEGHCQRRLRGMLEANVDLFSADLAKRILSPPAVDGKLDELFLHAERLGVRLYVLIDEYDNFANTILAGEGEAAYRAVTHGSGFLRDFFAALKVGTASGNLERLFITGVSPLAMDDVTSGFNIGTNISFARSTTNWRASPRPRYTRWWRCIETLACWTKSPARRWPSCASGTTATASPRAPPKTSTTPTWCCTT